MAAEGWNSKYYVEKFEHKSLKDGHVLIDASPSRNGESIDPNNKSRAPCSTLARLR